MYRRCTFSILPQTVKVSIIFRCFLYFLLLHTLSVFLDDARRDIYMSGLWDYNGSEMKGIFISSNSAVYGERVVLIYAQLSPFISTFKVHSESVRSVFMLITFARSRPSILSLIFVQIFTAESVCQYKVITYVKGKTVTPFSRVSLSQIAFQILVETVFHLTSGRMSDMKIQIFWDFNALLLGKCCLTCSIFTFVNKHKVTLLGPVIRRWRRRELSTQTRGSTSHKNWFFFKTAVRNSNLSSSDLKYNTFCWGRLEELAAVNKLT